MSDVIRVFASAGDCYLMEWSDWSSCVGTCIKGVGVDFGSVQVRSRAVLAQEPENLQFCPDQVWESRPCIGQCMQISFAQKQNLQIVISLPLCSYISTTKTGSQPQLDEGRGIGWRTC